MIILDTDTLTVIQRGSQPEYGRLRRKLEQTGDDEVCITVISYEEQMRGWLALLSGAKTATRILAGYAKLQATADEFAQRNMLPYDDAADVYFAQMNKAKIRIGTMDRRIAAIAMSRDALLISRNLRDFRQVPGLRVENWLD